jgi:hypothetical protein
MTGVRIIAVRAVLAAAFAAITTLEVILLFKNNVSFFR